jgi:hypothetical protein
LGKVLELGDLVVDRLMVSRDPYVERGALCFSHPISPCWPRRRYALTFIQNQLFSYAETQEMGTADFSGFCNFISGRFLYGVPTASRREATATNDRGKSRSCSLIHSRSDLRVEATAMT